MSQEWHERIVFLGEGLEMRLEFRISVSILQGLTQTVDLAELGRLCI